MTKRIAHLLLTLLIVLVPTFAATSVHKDGRKQMKAIKEQIKNRKGSDALKAVENLRKDSLYTWNPQLLQYGVEACKIMYEKENEKFYLKSKPDTTALFNSLYNIIDYILLTDSAERLAALPADTANVTDDCGMLTPPKYRYRKPNKEFISRFYTNFLAAPRYFNAQAKWDQTERFTSLAIDLGHSDIVSSYKRPVVSQTQLTDLSVQHVNACYRQKKFDAIESYADFALRDSANLENLIEKLAYCEVERGDTALYLVRLREGHRLYPSNMFFFSRLVDVYLRAGDNEHVLTTAKQTLESVLEAAQDSAQFCVIDTLGNYAQPDDALALRGVRSSVSLPSDDIAQIFEARAIAHHNNSNPRDCIEDAENILNWNPAHPRADFYIGASYYSMAENIKIPASVTDPNYKSATRERNRLLTLGRPHLEAYRKTAPDDSASWAPMLYETYLYLNLGPEFEEISHYIH